VYHLQIEYFKQRQQMLLWIW